jgi:hypothetical protein
MRPPPRRCRCANWSEESHRTGCARLPRRGEWDGFTEKFGCTEGGDHDGRKFGRTRQAALETVTDTRTRNKKSKNQSQTRKQQNDGR